MDQGANEAMVIGSFPDRRAAGLAEVAISKVMTDRTNWRNMLKNVVTDAPFDSYIKEARNMLTEEQKEHLLEDVRQHHKGV